MLLTIMSTEKDRWYQIKIDQEIDEAYEAGAKNVMPAVPTGGGKTRIFTGRISKWGGYSCAMAHRQELVSQISLALNKRGVQHFAFVPKNMVQKLISLHIREHGKSHYAPNSRCAVAGVDTLLARKHSVAAWCQRVGFWVIDEGHHVLRDNKWGKAVELFPPTALGLLPTATPERSDGRGLGRHADGIVDKLIIGPTGRQLMNDGFLSDYEVYAPTIDLHLTTADIGASGDYVQSKLIKKTRESKIVGGVVENYLKLAPGKLGLTFVPSVDIAADIAAAYRAAGVPAEVISAKTPDAIRFEANRRLANGDLKQLVNVDIFGEGYDCPAIEVVSFARATESYPVFSQQFGRALRVLPGKGKAIIIDHVGNFLRHSMRSGTPDSRNNWTLDARCKRTQERDPDLTPYKACPACTAVYEAYYPRCPHCGYVAIPAVRSSPEFVDGDLTIIDPDWIARINSEIAKIDEPADLIRNRMAGAGPMVANSAAKNHRLRYEAQIELREVIALWAGWQRYLSRPDAESYKRFYWRYGIDVKSAQKLGRPDAESLTARLKKDMGV